MSYQVIARKWRPQSFEEVTGQEPITDTLKSAIEHERLHHAYLFSGARGVGKTTTARLLAKALNCHKATKPTSAPCRIEDSTVCASCREIAEGRSMDVQEIDAASYTGVQNVRDTIIDTIAIRPARDRYKVFIIDEVHMLSTPAFNALLKTLEEPPPRVVFILATTEAHKVPDTILSRCQQFEFRTIPTAKIAARLKLIANAEKIDVDDAALREIARAGAGSMRDAQSAFDQTISFSFGKKIAVGDVENALGLASSEMLVRAVAAIAGESAKDALTIVDELVARGHDLRNFCRDLLAHLRDLLVVKIAGVEAELTDASESERRELARAGANFSESDLTRFFHSLTETERTLRESLHPRYQLEIGLVKLVEMRRLAPLESILARLNSLEELMRHGGSAPPSAAPNAQGAPPRANIQRGGTANQGARNSDAKTSNAFASTTQNSSPPLNLSASESTVQHHADGALKNDDVPPFETLPVSSASSCAPISSTAAAVKPVLELVASNTSLDWSNNPNAASETPSPTFFDSPPATTEAQKPRETSVVRQTSTEEAIAVDVKTSDDGASDLAAQIKVALDEERKPFLVIALEGAREVSVEGEDVYIEFPPNAKHLRDTLAKPENMKIVQTICRTIFGRSMGLRIVVGNGAQKAESRVSAPQEGSVVAFNPRKESPFEKVTQTVSEMRSKTISTPPASPDVKLNGADVGEEHRLIEEAKNHPRVKEALRIFGAEIIEVVKRDGASKAN